MYDSVAGSGLTMSYNYITTKFQNFLIAPNRNSVPMKQCLPVPTQAPARLYSALGLCEFAPSGYLLGVQSRICPSGCS